jgi:hypothetical protein
MEGEKNLTNYTNFLSLPERSDKDGGTTQPRFKLWINRRCGTGAVYSDLCVYSRPMKLNARGLAQHDSPPGWLEGSDPAGCDFLRDARSKPTALRGHIICPGLGLICYWMYAKHLHELGTSRKKGMVWWYSSIPMPSLCSRPPPAKPDRQSRHGRGQLSSVYNDHSTPPNYLAIKQPLSSRWLVLKKRFQKYDTRGEKGGCR